MKLAVVCNTILQEELISKDTAEGVKPLFIQNIYNIPSDADVVLDLLFENTVERINHLKHFLPATVIINSVTTTLREIQSPFVRINAWPTFLKRNILEWAILPGQSADEIESLFTALGWKEQQVPDITGMLSARVVANIINEAYFTFGDEVSSKEEIDIAMKLGTNYPYGPFEWAELIGIKKIVELLRALRLENKRYEIAPALIAESVD